MTRTLAACLALLLAVPPAAAQDAAGGVLGTPPGLVGVELIGGWPLADGTHLAAIEIRMAPGWHTYWRSPGEAGIPPQFDWSASDNLAAVRYEWPRPLVFDTYGIPTIGYRDRLVLPVLLEAERPGEPVRAALELFFGVCDDICVPANATVAATLPAPAAPAVRARVEAALADGAQTAREAGVESVRCRLVAAEGGYDLTAEIAFHAPPSPRPTAVVEAGDARFWAAPPETRQDGHRLVLQTRVEALEPGAWLERSAIRLTLLEPSRMIDIRGCRASE